MRNFHEHDEPTGCPCGVVGGCPECMPENFYRGVDGKWWPLDACSWCMKPASECAFGGSEFGHAESEVA